MASDHQDASTSLYPYKPNHGAAIAFSILIGISLFVHIYQNIRYKSWRLMFFMVWGGLVFMTGWIVRAASTFRTENSDLNRALYISQAVLVYAGPPIYAAAEYNILGRLMVYLPMHAPLHPYRVIWVFVYLGMIVESLTGAGAPRIADGLSEVPPDATQYKVGTTLISISLVLQAVVEVTYLAIVGVMYRRAQRAGVLTRRVRMLCFMLFGTSTLILSRCLFRAIQAFSATSLYECGSVCRVTSGQEWYLYVFEAAQMVVYTYWLNIIHPGTLLPRAKNTYLDVDATTERVGPGWIDRRPRWETFIDPLDIGGMTKGQPSHDKFWLRPEEWPIAEGEGASRGAVRLGSEKSAA